MCEKGWKGMKLSENTISPTWKKHKNLPSNNNDAHSITKYGSLVRPGAQIVALRAHCAKGPAKLQYATGVLACKAYRIGQ